MSRPQNSFKWCCQLVDFQKQVWQWPYEAPGIVDSGLYAITFRCGPKDMCLEKYILISQKNVKQAGAELGQAQHSWD